MRAMRAKTSTGSSPLSRSSRAAAQPAAGVAPGAIICLSAVDHVVPPDNQREIHESIAPNSKSLVKLENSCHVTTMDDDRGLIFAATLKFVNANRGS